MATVESLLKDALKLSPEERASLVEALDQSVLEAFGEEPVEAAWLAEVKRRTADRRAGRSRPQSWAEVYGEVRGELDDPAA